MLRAPQRHISGYTISYYVSTIVHKLRVYVTQVVVLQHLASNSVNTTGILGAWTLRLRHAT